MRIWWYGAPSYDWRPSVSSSQGPGNATCALCPAVSLKMTMTRALPATSLHFNLFQLSTTNRLRRRKVPGKHDRWTTAASARPARRRTTTTTTARLPGRARRPGRWRTVQERPRGVEAGATLAGLEAKKKFFRVSEESDTSTGRWASGSRRGRRAAARPSRASSVRSATTISSVGHVPGHREHELFRPFCGGLGWLILAESEPRQVCNQGAQKAGDFWARRRTTCRRPRTR